MPSDKTLKDLLEERRARGGATWGGRLVPDGRGGIHKVVPDGRGGWTPDKPQTPDSGRQVIDRTP